MNQHILEKLDIVSGFVPINIGSARAGDVVSMKNWGRCAIVFFGAAGTAGEDPTLTVEQCSNVAASNAKAINFTRVDIKQGTLTAVETWTKVTQAAGNTYTNTDAAEIQKIWVVEVKAEDLDVDNGFDCIRASVGDAGSTNQLAAMLYLLHEPRFAKEGGVSSIVN